ncbi:MAG: glutamate racemase [Enterobacterales bacterium]|nr:glutamate racemase [Enterobacterales bacterium]
MTKAYHKDQSLPIGLFDSGIGGLSLLKALRLELPKENYIYLADTRHAPYGPQSEEFIAQRVLAMANFLVQKKVKAMLVACNTATAAAVKQLREIYPIPIIGLEPALKPAIEACKNKRLGVLATEATLQSEKYKNLKQKVAKDLYLVEKGSKELVELIETGDYQNEQARQLIESELALFKLEEIDTLVLGCSHFPFFYQKKSKKSSAIR